MSMVWPAKLTASVPYSEKLAALARCPACGAKRASRTGETVFECTGEWRVANGEIIVANPCPAPSHVAARALNKEVEGETKREASQVSQP